MTLIATIVKRTPVPTPTGTASGMPRASFSAFSGGAVARDACVAGADVAGGTSAVNALTRLRTPKPYSGSRPGGPLSVAVAVRRWMTSGAERFGYLARTRAAAPETIAVASLVPVPVLY